MKFARLVYGNNKKQLASAQYANIGDYFQTFAIDHIYKEIGIPKSDIITIDRSKIQEYKKSDEKVILPMQGWFGYIKGIEIFPMPKGIIPAFLGYHCTTSKNYSQRCLETYLKYAPIGCRDEKTYLLMKKHGIPAYLTGCLTITLPERTQTPKSPHLFLVDAPHNIEKYIPSELKQNITYISQEVPFNPENTDEYEICRLEKLAYELLNRYKNEATLIVTSRLHCAAPCLGMGIPVILARNYFDDRYAWIDKYLPLYTPDKFESINWYPQKVDLTDIKLQLIEMTRQILMNLADKEDIMEHVHDFYMNRQRQKISVPFSLKAYLKLHEITPKTADFLREVILKKYTVSTARDKSEV